MKRSTRMPMWSFPGVMEIFAAAGVGSGRLMEVDRRRIMVVAWAHSTAGLIVPQPVCPRWIEHSGLHRVVNRLGIAFQVVEIFWVF